MAELSILISGRSYAITCRDGEEEQLRQLAALVDAKAQLARKSSPGLTEVRQLLFAALFLADELAELKRESAGRQNSLALETPASTGNKDTGNAAHMADALEHLADRIESLAEKLTPSLP